MVADITPEYRHWNLNYEKRFLKEFAKEQKTVPERRK